MASGHWVHHLGTPCRRHGLQAYRLLTARRRCNISATSSDQGGPTTSRRRTHRPCLCHHHRSSSNHFSVDPLRSRHSVRCLASQSSPERCAVTTHRNSGTLSHHTGATRLTLYRPKIRESLKELFPPTPSPPFACDKFFTHLPSFPVVMLVPKDSNATGISQQVPRTCLFCCFKFLGFVCFTKRLVLVDGTTLCILPVLRIGIVGVQGC